MRIFLRPITEKDGEHIVKWRNSEKVLKHCMTKTPITLESHMQYYRDRVLTGKNIQFIVERIEEESCLAAYPIATVYLKDVDNENKRCELCIFTSNDVEWDLEGQSIAIKMLLEKAFNEYGLHKVYSYVYSKYPEELELLKKTGFIVEATLKQEALDTDGLFEDIIRLYIMK